jgi:small GTP-binding protein
MYEARFVFIGDVGVGKTAFSDKLINGSYSNHHDTTIGVDYFSNIVTINNHSVKCKIWDTTGLKSFAPFTQLYYNDIAGAVLFYDVNCRETFDNLHFWINELNQHGPEYRISKLLIGNKIDKPRQVSFQQAKEFAEDNEFLYVEMSIKDDFDVSDKLEIIVKDICQNKAENKGLIPVLKKRRCCCQYW